MLLTSGAGSHWSRGCCWCVVLLLLSYGIGMHSLNNKQRKKRNNENQKQNIDYLQITLTINKCACNDNNKNNNKLFKPKVRKAKVADRQKVSCLSPASVLCVCASERVCVLVGARTEQQQQQE